MITIPQAQKILNVTYRSAQINVAKLVAAGVLEQMGESSYGKAFVAKAILRIVSDQRF